MVLLGRLLRLIMVSLEMIVTGMPVMLEMW